jgi:hypothetical protein
LSDARKNLATTTVATAPTPATTGTQLAVAAGEAARFPTPPFNATIWPADTIPTPANAEIVRVQPVAAGRVDPNCTWYNGFAGGNDPDIQAGDLGKTVSGAGWLGTETITSVNPGSDFSTDVGPTADGTGPLTIGTPPLPADTFTIARTQEGTAARAIAVGDQFAQTITDRMLDDIEHIVVFSIPDYAPPGHVFDGAHGDDAPYVQAAVNAAAAVGGGTIYWPPGCVTNIQTCINLPARGNYELRGAGGISASYFLVNASKPATGIRVTATIGGQHASAPAACQFIFQGLDAANESTGQQGEACYSFRNLMAYNTAGNAVGLVALSGNVYAWDVRSCELQLVGAACLVNIAGAGQTYSGIIDGNIGQGWLMWAVGGSPFIGVISHNTWYVTGDTQNPMPLGEAIDQVSFWTWYVHDNVFQSAGGPCANPRAVIAAHTLDQTILGAIHHNAFYGATGGCIYWKDDYDGTINNASGGLTIDFNQFVGWNQHGFALSTFAAAALYLDHSTAPTGPDQQILVGPNTFSGGAQTGGGAGAYHGIHVIDSPTPETGQGNPPTHPTSLNGILISPLQLFREVANANVIIDNGPWAGTWAYVPAKNDQLESGNVFTAGAFVSQFGVKVGGAHFSGSSASDISAVGTQALYVGYNDGNGVVHFVNQGATNEVLTLDAAAKKLGFYGHATATQPASAAQAAAPVGGVGTAAGGYDTAAHRDALIALVNEIRNCLVNNGLMKGSA